MQMISVGGEWTRRLAGEALTAWAARVSADDGGPDGCDHHKTWTSNGETIKLCTKCAGDESETACKARHDEALEFWLGIYPEA